MEKTFKNSTNAIGQLYFYKFKTDEVHIFPDEGKMEHYDKTIKRKNRSVLLFGSCGKYSVFRKVWQTGFGIKRSDYYLLPYASFNMRVQRSISNEEFEELKKLSICKSWTNSYYKGSDFFRAIKRFENPDWLNQLFPQSKIELSNSEIAIIFEEFGLTHLDYKLAKKKGLLKVEKKGIKFIIENTNI